MFYYLKYYFINITYNVLFLARSVCVISINLILSTLDETDYNCLLLFLDWTFKDPVAWIPTVVISSLN
jgi:hypothetical protein